VTGLLDTVGMFDLAAALPEQVAAAAILGAEVDGLPEHDAIENVVVLGMGGSGIAGDVLTSIAGPFMPVPVVVCKGYTPPSFVSDSTLCFAISFSGNTEETIEAAQEAAVAGARMVAITRGGELGALAEAWKAPIVRLPDGIPMPRAGIGAVSIPPLVVLEQIGLFPGASGWIAEAVTQLKKRRDALIKDGSDIQHLSRRIGRTMPIIYGGGGVGGAAAARWKAQCNENAKVPAFAASMPELCHNEICGWGQHGDVTRQVFSLIHLRHDGEHPQIMRRFDLVAEIMREIVAGVETVQAEGEGALAQLFDLVIQGDFLSLHLAANEGIDPGPIPILEDLKAALAAD
jgi:glucose/mannose-6-phosphate isomerase